MKRIPLEERKNYKLLGRLKEVDPNSYGLHEYGVCICEVCDKPVKNLYEREVLVYADGFTYSNFLYGHKECLYKKNFYKL